MSRPAVQRATVVDLAVRVGRLADAQLVARRVGTMRFFACASPEYLAAAPPLEHPRDLKQHRCIAYSGLRTGTLWEFSRRRKKYPVRVDPVLLCNDSQAIRDAVLAGVGIGLQGDYMAGELLTQGRLVELLADWDMPQWPVHLLWLPAADRDPALRCLIDFLVDALASQ